MPSLTESLVFRANVDTRLSDEIRGLESRVERFVASRIHNPADAADIVQEALTRLIARSRETEIAQPEFYALTIARNLINDHHRGGQPTLPLDDALICPDPIADEILAGRQRLALFFAALATMPPLRREVFVRRRLDDQSSWAVGEAMGLTPETVKKHVTRALSTFAIKLT